MLLAQDFVFLGCHKVVSDPWALSQGRASSVLSISFVFISEMRLEKGIATSTKSRMGFLFVLYCLLPGFCHWIMERRKGSLQSLFLRLRKEWESGAGWGGKRTQPNFNRSSHPALCPAALTYIYLHTKDGRERISSLGPSRVPVKRWA